MMKAFAALKQRYFGLTRGPRHCSGNVRDAKALAREGGDVWVPWDAGPGTGSGSARVRRLDLSPNRTQAATGRLPRWVPALPGLAHLVVELPSLARVEEQRLPPALRSLLISRNLDNDNATQRLYPKPFVWPRSLVLRRLKALMVIPDNEASQLLAELSPECFPGLEYLECTATDARPFDRLKAFAKLSHLVIGFHRAPEAFEKLAALRLESLDIEGGDRALDFGKLATLKHVKAIRLNGVRAPVDCRVFAKMPQLTSIDLLNCPNLEHVAALSRLRGFSALRILSCRNAVDPKTRQALQAAQFKTLDIAYA